MHSLRCSLLVLLSVVLVITRCAPDRVFGRGYEDGYEDRITFVDDPLHLKKNRELPADTTQISPPINNNTKTAIPSYYPIYPIPANPSIYPINSIPSIPSAPKEPSYDSNRQGRVSYEGAQVWNVDIDNESLRVIGNLTRNQEIAAWGGDHNAVDFLIKYDNLQKIANIMNNHRINYRIVIDNLQKNIEEENPPLSEEEQELQQRKARAFRFWNSYSIKGHIAMPVVKPASRRMAMLGAYMGYNSLDDQMEYWPTANWGHRMTWMQYHRLADIHGFLDYLAITYPQICSVMTIGTSHEGRPLKVLRISNGGYDNKAVWIDGGIHAREWISPATVTYIINEFVENYDDQSDLVKNTDWYFMPVVNPDGYEYTHTVDRLWRKNRRGYGSCSGVDLNRNFGYHWGEHGTSKNPCSEVYAGSSAFSEPESKAISDFFSRSSANFKLYISYHSYGQLILYPWGYDKVVPPDHKDLERVGNRAAQAIQAAGGSAYKVGASSIVLYPAAGGSDDWAKAVGNIKYSYTIELSDTGRYGFVLPAKFITKVARESLAALKVMAESATAA